MLRGGCSFLTCMAHKSSNQTDEPGNEKSAASRLLRLAGSFLGTIEAARPNFGQAYHQITAIQKAAEELGISALEFPALEAPPDTFGNEHEVWFPPGQTRVWKATYPDCFGIAVGREGEATPFEYLERISLRLLKAFGRLDPAQSGSSPVRPLWKEIPPLLRKSPLFFNHMAMRRCIAPFKLQASK